MNGARKRYACAGHVQRILVRSLAKTSNAIRLGALGVWVLAFV